MVVIIIDVFKEQFIIFFLKKKFKLFSFCWLTKSFLMVVIIIDAFKKQLLFL